MAAAASDASYCYYVMLQVLLCARASAVACAHSSRSDKEAEEVAGVLCWLLVLEDDGGGPGGIS